MTPSALARVLADMKLRFTSANEIPVERASIRRGEWDVILAALTPAVEAGEQRAGTHIRCDCGREYMTMCPLEHVPTTPPPTEPK